MPDRTLKNFLVQALKPAGQVLYIYGGGWNYEDTKGDKASAAIGLSDRWLSFFRGQDQQFSYLNYRTQGFNQYHCLGLDCSGYIGWAVYNTMCCRSGGPSFVVRASRMAKTYAEYGWGTFVQGGGDCISFQPGDIFSMDGHVWICLGVCTDGSIVILHSTPSMSKAGCPGGGVQVGALGESKQCEAYRLADTYMRSCCCEWSRRYCAALKSRELYTEEACETCGRFRWHLNECGLKDPEGIAQMDAKTVLHNLMCRPGC